MAVGLAPAQEPDAPASGAGRLRTTIERLGRFAYAGDPVMVRIAVFNTGDSAFPNSTGLDLIGSTAVVYLDEGLKLEHRDSAGTGPGGEPQVLQAGGFFGFITDLSQVVKGLDRPGRYKARLELPETDAAEVDLVIIERYDPARAYRAVVETEYGELTFDLLGSAAPKHVQNFYDLANQGYYDGTFFYSIVKGIEIHAGDKIGDGRSSPGYSLPAEIDESLKHGRGTLSMLRAGPVDHGSLFVISLGDNSRLDGVFSIFGKMARGEEALKALENLPTGGTRAAVPYQPLQKTPIQKVRVEPAPPDSAATAARGGDGTGSTD